MDFFEELDPNPSQNPLPDASQNSPLADQLRPKTLSDVIGQDHLIGEKGILRAVIAGGKFPSLILWGAAGCGKTTLARLLAQSYQQHHGGHYEQISAIFSGIADLKKIFDAARQRRKMGKQTLLFVDEIHRFNKSQQDAFLPVIEDGTIILIGATTENPSFELNNALLSRTQVLTLNRLTEKDLEKILERAEAWYQKPFPLAPAARYHLLYMADGDGRYLLSMVENVIQAIQQQNLGWIDEDLLPQLIQKRQPLYDKADDAHYSLISALHKSVRGSDPDAALYWLARMLDAGEDPLYLIRRITRMAYEDIGLADSRAMGICLDAWQIFERTGAPEGELAIAQALVYVACAPKSNAVYTAFKQAKSFVQQTGTPPPPAAIINAPTKLMKDQGFGAGYEYDHDTPDTFSGQNYFPESLLTKGARPEFYHPKNRGQEQIIQQRLEEWKKLRIEKQGI
jgi:putative ATPase